MNEVRSRARTRGIMLYNNPIFPKLLNERQLLVHAAKNKTILVLAGNRFGKSCAAVNQALIECLDRKWLQTYTPHLIGYKKHEPPVAGRVMSIDFDNGVAGVILPEFRKWTPLEQLRGGSWKKAYSEKDRRIHFANGSFIDMVTHRQEGLQQAGATRNFIIYDEEPPEALRNENLTRTVTMEGSYELFAMTPLKMTWTLDWREHYDRGTLPPAVDLTVIEGKMEDNQAVRKENLEHLMAFLGEEEGKARRYGTHPAMGGRIYPQLADSLTRERYMIDQPEKLNSGEKTIVAIDPSPAHTGILWGNLDQKGKLIIFDEFHGDRKLRDCAYAYHKTNAKWRINELDRPAWGLEEFRIKPPLSFRGKFKEICFMEPEDLAAYGMRDRNEAEDLIMEMCAAFFRPNVTLIDPHSSSRDYKTHRSDQDGFNDCHVPTKPAQADPEGRITAVRDLLESDRLYIARECERFWWEAKRYRRKTPANNPDASESEKPVKKDDDVMDCLGYLCMERESWPEYSADKPKFNPALAGHLEKPHLYRDSPLQYEIERF